MSGKEYLVSTVGAFLSSSCCLVQLGLNLFSYGCAGFNTVLGPYRPYLMAFTMASLGYTWHKIQRQIASGECDCGILWYQDKRYRFLIHAGIVVAIAISPEIVQFINDNKNISNKSSNETITIKIEGMGCESCRNKVKNSLDDIQGVTGSTVDLENKLATIHINSDIAQVSDEQLVTAITEGGFEAEIQERKQTTA
eukprot:TRINITY_DN11118_c0_g1_i1.p1 TRINITY_DN11118_c0_g1~~TRINITY_DN11118_c0_g1_i1.p1  ORF type:complete len:196 (+),score=26.54 TRINITY_DN11118_c0_g1_i1:781-1368(+)